MPNGEYGQSGYRVFLNENGGVTLMVFFKDGEHVMASFPCEPDLLESIGNDLVSIAYDCQRVIDKESTPDEQPSV